MSKFVVIGSRKLSGQIRVSGNKNAVLAEMAACVLTGGDCVLENVPQIADVTVMAEILRSLGAKVVGVGTSRLEISCAKIDRFDLPDDLVAKLRASVLFFGPMLSRFGKIQMRHPGGCIIGRRPVGIHFDAMHELGARIEVTKEDYVATTSGLVGTTIFLSEASVTATESTIMAAVLSKGVTTVKHAASEPHVVDLCRFLTAMGAKIEGVGSSLLTITGVDSLGGVTHVVRSEHIEAGTYAIAAAATGGSVKIVGVEQEDMEPILRTLSQFNVNFKLEAGELTVNPSQLSSPSKVVTGTWPSFPTDLMSCLIVLATQSRGVVLLHDWMYESRMFFVDKLIAMGANVTIADPHRVVVYGPSTLRGKELDTPDLRAGMAIIIAALCAEGESVIDRIELVDRGYEKIDEKLQSLGAKIKRVAD